MFRIWYTDFIYDGNTLEDWKNAPESGVVGIYQTFGFRDNIRLGKMFNGSDWYWMNLDGSIDHSIDSAIEPETWIDFNIPQGAIAKKGKWVSNERMLEVNNQIVELMQN